MCSSPGLKNEIKNLSFLIEKRSFCLFVCYMFSCTIRHMREIQALHSRQKEEIDCLFTKLGKVPHVCETSVHLLSELQL